MPRLEVTLLAVIGFYFETHFLISVEISPNFFMKEIIIKYFSETYRYDFAN
jgi:hypothetical protein